MTDRRSPTPAPHLSLTLCCGCTILISAFLLFQVQPLISKMILPWFGGTPAVWTTCMLFFQMLLLGGYTYAHFLVRIRSFVVQAAVHAVLLAVALAVLPITPDASWRPREWSDPTWRIIVILAGSVGLPFFVLSSTAPLVQAWYARATRGASPYRLYALSNAGSLTALLSYPFLIEPWLTTTSQDRIWSLTFGLFAISCLGLFALIWWRARVPLGGLQLERELEKDLDRVPGEGSGSASPERPPYLYERVAWLLLPALASLLLLAVTNHVCQDVAVVPFLWVVPLSLYLLSFIICFDSEAWYIRPLFGLLSAAAVVAIAMSTLAYEIDDLLVRWEIDFELTDYTDQLVIEAAIYLSALFFLCMLCHGELVRLKPAHRWLTSFYLSIAAGGALGGLFVAVLCPLIFSAYWELNIGLVAGFALATLVVWFDGKDRWLKNNFMLQWTGAFAVAGSVMLLVHAQWQAIQDDSLVAVRNFYGVLRVSDDVSSEDPADHTRALYNGRILHGIQSLDAEQQRLATSYYHRDSGVGITMRRYPRPHPWRVAVIGLGTGNMAVYGEPGDFYRFYEINPVVPVLARRYFTYLSDSPAEIDTLLGDARLSMQREEPQNYDIIVIDAFSGDAIPSHLLTKEALGIYQKHLRPGGVIAVHISNRHLDLVPVVAALAEYGEFHPIKIEKEGDYGPLDAISDWMLLTRNEQFIEDDEVELAADAFEGTYVPVPLWTDQYSNLFRILQ